MSGSYRKRSSRRSTSHSVKPGHARKAQQDFFAGHPKQSLASERISQLNALISENLHYQQALLLFKTQQKVSKRALIAACKGNYSPLMHAGIIYGLSGGKEFKLTELGIPF